MAWPASPATGDTWTEYGQTWVFDGNGWIASAPVAVNAKSLPAFLANGTPSPIPLNADGSLPAYLANGTYSPIQTQA